ncbi:MAG TPA: hypothetical protein VHI13_16780 [Candidatus Kapabacteria bacterium]|nr:hypothetical protein [Candidatus Kapabacteria bacterium]
MVRTFADEWDAITAIVQEHLEATGIDPASVRQGMLGDDVIDGESVWISLLPGALTPGIAAQPVQESATCTIWVTAVSTDGRAAARKRGVHLLRGLIDHLTTLSRSGRQMLFAPGAGSRCSSRWRPRAT